jgi:4-hydroxyphenylpyruvate dioxygenase
VASKLVKSRRTVRKKGVWTITKPRWSVIPADKNPLGTDGFEFVEHTAPAIRVLGALFEKLGFQAVARQRSKDVVLYQQGDINFILNHEPHSFAQSFARVHGPWVCAFAIRVKDAPML